MQADREDPSFQKITISIESQDEFDYLLALSNSSVAQVRDGAHGLQLRLKEPFTSTQMKFHQLLSGFRK